MEIFSLWLSSPIRQMKQVFPQECVLYRQLPKFKLSQAITSSV
jgi:hypothetical protein